MQGYTWLGNIWLLIISLVLALPLRAPAQDIVRAKIGIQIQRHDRAVRAKTRDRIRAGEQFRIYVVPEQDAYIYLIHQDSKTVNLLYETKVVALSPVILPSNRSFYQVDGTSSQELITIICSTHEIQDIRSFFNANKSNSQWKQIENQLVQESKFDLNPASQKPFAIAGNVRAQANVDITNPGHQVNREGEQISLPINVHNATTRALTFRATKLPPGLAIDAATGVISGTIKSGAAANSPYHVQIAVSQNGNSSEAIFAWTIDQEPFLQQLQIFSGRSFLVKQYAFTVKK